MGGKCQTKGDWEACGRGTRKFSLRKYCPLGYATCNDMRCVTSENLCASGLKYSIQTCSTGAPTALPSVSAAVFTSVTEGRSCAASKGCSSLTSEQCDAAMRFLTPDSKKSIQSKINTPQGCFAYKANQVYFNTHRLARGSCTK